MHTAGLTCALWAVLWTSAAYADPELSGEWRFEVEGGSVAATVVQRGAKVSLRLEGSQAAETLDGEIRGSRLELSRPVEVRDLTIAGGAAACRDLAQAQLARLAQDPRFRRRITLDVDPSGRAMAGRYETQPQIRCIGQTVELGVATTIPVRMSPLCAALSGTLPIGAGAGLSARLALSESLPPVERAKDPAARQGFCHYTGYGVGALSLSTGDVPGGTGTFALSLPITFADVDFYVRAGADRDDAKAYRDVHVSYADNGTRTLVVLEATPSFPISFLLDAAGLRFRIDDAGAVSLAEAYVEFRMDAGAEVQLGGPVYLGGDLTAPLRYTWTDGARTWADGTWSFDALAAVEIQVRREGRAPVASAALAVERSGKATLALALAGEQRVSQAGYALELRSCSLMVRVDLNELEWEIVRGSLDGGFEVGAPLSGSFGFRIAYEDANLRMAIESSSQVRAFGVPIQELALAVDLDPNTLVFREVSGSVAFAHPDLDQRLAIQSFRVTDGALVEFVGDGRAAYRGFTLDIQRVAYGGRDPMVLEVSAMLGLGWSRTGAGAVDLRNFTIDASGAISRFDIDARISASPVDVRLHATFDRNDFRGRFAGTFAGAASFDGAVVIGARPSPEDYRYGYLSMSLELTRGVPLGQTGLTLLGLNGAFGCNYLPAGSPLGAAEGPLRDSYYLQAGLTVGDVGGLARLNGTLSLVLGPEASAVQIAGRLQLTQRQPYMVGMVTANYVFGRAKIDGILSSDLRLPASGAAVRAAGNVLLYGLEDGRYRVASPGPSLSAELFGLVRLTEGNLSLAGELRAPIDTMRGSLSGRMYASTDVVIGWPRGFAPWGDGAGGSCSRVRRRGQSLDCTCTSATDSPLGIGAVGGLTLTLSGPLRAALTAAGTTGEFDIRGYFAGSAAITLPTSGWFGEPCARSLALEATAGLRATAETQLLRLRGDVQFVDGSGNELLAVAFDQTL
jgi:hypothetical protein